MENLVIGMGEALWDVLPDGKKLGGAPANFAYHISQFGLRSAVVSAIGDDALGREIADCFNSRNLRHNLEVVPYPTGTVQVEVDGCGVPQYEIRENVAWDNIHFTDALEELASATKALCFGSLAQRNTVSRATIFRYLDAIPASNDPLIVFDINLRQNFYSEEIIRESMKRCNILKINDEELDTIGRMFGYPDIDVEEKCRRLLEEYGLKILILTCGTAGSYVFTAESVSYQPTPKVEVADTVGAGDSFTAAFIASILRGGSVAEAHSRAVQTSAYVCTQNGAMPELPPELTA